MKVCIAQIRPKLLNVENNLDLHLKYINNAREKGLDIIVFPELSLTGYLTGWMTPIVALDLHSYEIKKILDSSKGMAVVFGAIIEENGQFYNSAVFVEDGEIRGIHKKVYLPTYGMFDEGRFFTAGSSFNLIHSRLGKFGILICEDAWHLDSYLSYADADYILLIANNPLRVVISDNSVNVWHRIASIPPLFFGIPTIYANRVGVEDGIIFFGGSRVINGDGSVEAEGKIFEEDFITAEIKPHKSRAAKYKSATLREHLNAIRKNPR
ncbi:MAG: nitrilase-related carbon-nitrogen hydrolase [candidate division WOR-3 bacterium]